MVYAEFIGFQDGIADFPPAALFNIQGEHKRAGSTVGVNTLKALGIDVPETPSYEDWLKRARQAA